MCIFVYYKSPRWIFTGNPPEFRRKSTGIPPEIHRNLLSFGPSREFIGRVVMRQRPVKFYVLTDDVRK